MADQYIDQLTELTTAADGDLLAINDIDDGANGTTKKITVANLFEGRGGGGTEFFGSGNLITATSDTFTSLHSFSTTSGKRYGIQLRAFVSGTTGKLRINLTGTGWEVYGIIVTHSIAGGNVNYNPFNAKDADLSIQSNCVVDATIMIADGSTAGTVNVGVKGNTINVLAGWYLKVVEVD